MQLGEQLHQRRDDNWMQTYTGVRFWPTDPRPDEICIKDIAGALSKLCRYGGHCLRFYSVAEHCVHIAEHAALDLKLDALLHDASEAYIVDVPRPIKPELTNYYELEDRVMQAVAERFSTIWPLPDEIKRLDAAILDDERKQNMRHVDVTPNIWGNTVPGLGVKLRFWEPRDAYDAFLEAFYRYGGK